MKYAVVVPARNEEQYIERTLNALKRQTIPPHQLIVVDDGSTDRTKEKASKYADLVVELPNRGFSVLGRPELSQVINEGLRHVERAVDYVLICGADNVLPNDYVETVTHRMKANPQLVIASARAKGEPYSETSPRGGSRLVLARFWRDLNGMRYPVAWGWEPWLIFKARQLGYTVRCFHDIVSEPQRQTGLVRPRGQQAEYGGKIMYALGYDWKYVLGRCIFYFVRSPKAGLDMFLGWLLHTGVQKLDVADWVNRHQKQLFWKRVLTIIQHGGRR